MEQLPERSETTKPGASSGPGSGREIRGMVRVAAEWRSTGPEGGADGDDAKGARCPVIVRIQRWFYLHSQSRLISKNIQERLDFYYRTYTRRDVVLSPIEFFTVSDTE